MMIFAATIILIVAALLLVSPTYLVLKNTDTGEIYEKWKLSEISTFEVEFIHSVNKTPVADIYEIRQKEIILSATRYRGFGAGVPTAIEGDQVLEYDNEGNMIITGYNVTLPSVSYVVGTVYDHILTINETTSINLTQTCGKNSHVTFIIERRHPWD
ncbi:MAG: DUF1850 domain-containing protein [Eubacteriaceae bacterium]|nr:DUF1850 domain-containing protein [Eubacteriaceae bacterium]